MSSLPAFKAMGAGHDTTPVIPTHASGDYMLLPVESAADDVPTPSGWTKIGSWFDSTDSTCLTLFERFATSSSETNPSISSADHAYGAVYLATGVNPSNARHNLSPHFTPSRVGLSTAPGLTTQLPNCLILNIWSRHIDNQTGALSSGAVNATVDGGTLTTQFDAGTIAGNGGGLVIIESAKAVAGVVGFTNISFSVSVGSAVVTLALQSAGENFGIKSQIVNKGDHMPIQTLISTPQSFDVWMADSTDGSTGKTSLTVAIGLRKYGAVAYTTLTVVVTEVGTGTYAVDATGTHMNTYGLCSARGTSSGAYPAELVNFLDVVADNKNLLTPFVGGTAQTGGSSTITLTSGSSATDDLYKGLVVVIASGTGAGQARRILSYVGSTKIATVATAWATNPDNTSVYALVPDAGVNVVGWNGTAIAVPATAGIPDVNAKNWNNLTTVDLPLAPTTAGRKLDVSAGGEAGLDWANIGTPSTTVGLSGTTIKNSTDNATTEATLATAAALTTAQTDLTTLTGRLTSLRAGYLDNLSAGAVALASALVTAQTDLTTLTGRLTSLRAGYLDNLSAGAVALASALATAQTALTDLTNDVLVRRNTATAGGASTITLDGGASSTNSFYKNTSILIVSGTGAGQVRGYSSYVGSSKLYTVDSAWATNPDNTSVFALIGSVGGDTSTLATLANQTTMIEAAGIIRRGTSLSDGSLTTSIALDAGASATNDFYNNATIIILSGTGALQFRNITDYVGSTKVATVDRAWTTNPTTDSVFLILAAGGSVDVAAIAAAAAASVDDTLVVGPHTIGDVRRLTMAIEAGPATDFTTGTQTYRCPVTGTVRLTVTSDATGRLTTTLGDLT